jgi:dihydrofolate synthase/folylpolyglutamate synthase
VSLSDRDRVAEHLNTRFGEEFAPAESFSLAPLERALELLKRPQDRLPPTIHVAGTNGKGSTCAFMRAIAEAAGLRVHVFSKPHLLQTRERVRLAGRLVCDDAFVEAIERVSATGCSLRHFEGQTAAAFLLFAETPADLLILETGVGGTHDATNVIDCSAVCVLTPVDIDHAAALGESRVPIARHKAGILKPGTPAVIARQPPDALGAIEAFAAKQRTPIFRCGVDWDVYQTNGRMAVQTENRLYDLPLPKMFGAHQVGNAGAAVVAMSLLNDARVTDDSIARGANEAFIPARMQNVARGTLGVENEIWIDGAHNPHGARALAASLRELDRRAPRSLVAIVGMLQRKDADGFFEALSGSADLVLTTPIANRDCVREVDLMQIAASRGLNAVASPGVREAVSLAATRVPDARIVICGSLALAGEALRLSGGLG